MQENMVCRPSDVLFKQKRCMSVITWIKPPPLMEGKNYHGGREGISLWRGNAPAPPQSGTGRPGDQTCAIVRLQASMFDGSYILVQLWQIEVSSFKCFTLLHTLLSSHFALIFFFSPQINPVSFDSLLSWWALERGPAGSLLSKNDQRSGEMMDCWQVLGA